MRPDPLPHRREGLDRWNREEREGLEGTIALPDPRGLAMASSTTLTAVRRDGCDGWMGKLAMDGGWE